jgi:rubrerythrin
MNLVLVESGIRYLNSLAHQPAAFSPAPLRHKHQASKPPKIKPIQVIIMPAEIINCPKCGISISNKQVCPFCDKSKKEGKEEEEETKAK